MREMCRCTAILLMMLPATVFSAGLQGRLPHTHGILGADPGGRAIVSPSTLCLGGMEKDSSDLGYARGGSERAGQPEAGNGRDGGERELGLDLGFIWVPGLGTMVGRVQTLADTLRFRGRVLGMQGQTTPWLPSPRNRVGAPMQADKLKCVCFLIPGKV